MSATANSGRFAFLLPPAGLARRLCVVTLLQSLGSGVFLTSSALFFVRFLNLSATEVGLGFTVATAVAAALTLPLSRLGDTLGRKPLWSTCLLVDVFCFALYPAVRGFPAFLLVVTVLATSEAAGATSRAAYTISILPPERRVQTFAWTRSAFNLGFAVGAGVSAMVVTVVQISHLSVLPWTMAGLLALTFALVLRLPAQPGPGGGSATMNRPSDRRRSVLRDLPFVRLAFVTGIQSADEPLMLVVVPLWLAGLEGVPDVMVPLVVVTNTVLVIVAQVRLSRGVDDVAGGVAAATTAGWLLGLGSLVLVATGTGLRPAVTIAVVLAAVVLLTFGEIKSSASGWVLAAELSPEESRTEYQACWRLTGQFWRAVTPAAGVGLVSGLGSSGWLVIAGLFVASGYGVRAATASCRRNDASEEAEFGG